MQRLSTCSLMFFGLVFILYIFKTFKITGCGKLGNHVVHITEARLGIKMQ